MDPQRHIIRTQAIQVGMTRPESAQAVLDLTGTLWRTRLAAEAEEIFSASCQPHEHVRLERLELALGTIPEEAFAREFPIRFRARLGEELRRQLRRLRDGETGAGRLTPAGRSPLELLEYLLLHGLMPWWGPQDAAFDPARALVEALAHTPRAAAALVRRIGRHRRVRLRLVQWLDDPAIAALIRAVAPGEAEFVLRYAADLDARQEEKRFVPAGAAEFRQAKWEVILGHLLADRGSRFNAKAFLAQTLRELAGRFRLEYTALLAELARVAADARLVWRESSLPQLLGELYAEETRGRGAGPVAAWRAVWSDALRERPAPGRTPHRAALAFWRELSAADARTLIRELIARHGAEALVNFLADGFPAEEHAELLRILRTPVPGEPADDGRKIPWLAETLAGISTAREQAADRARRPEAEGGEELALPALRILLETGMLPAAPWAQRWRARPGTWLNLMLARHAEAVPPLLRAWAQAGRLTAAMAARLPDPALESVVEVLEPAGAEDVIAVVQITLQARPVAAGRPPPAAAWRELTWRIVLDYLLLDRGSVFNTRSFLAHNMSQLAARHQVDVRLVWESLVVVAEQDGRHALLDDLRAIRPAGPVTMPGEEPPRRALFSEQSLRRSALARLRLLQLVLAGSPLVSEAWLQALLPLLWELLVSRDEAVEFMRRTPGDSGATDLILRTGGTEFLTELFFAREPAQAALWRDAVSWLENSPAAAALFPGGRAGLRHRLWRALAELWCEGGGQPVRDVADFLARILGRLGMRGRADLAAGHTPAQAAREILRALLEQDGTREAAELARRLPGRPLRRPASPAEKRTEPEAEQEREKTEEEKAEPEEVERDDDRLAPITVSNAGLVLLLPFFPELFKRCGWLDDGMFRDFEATQRAVHLLQFLVSDGARTHEYSLALNKILCGLEPEAAVVSRVKLADAEEAAGRQLLEQVVGRWARGAAISVDGLRTSYLHRPGWLRRTAEGWSLRVESRGWDVLLADLPWSFPGSRPAWMPRPLEVDWI